MPTVTPDSPGEFSPFDSEFQHVRAHRGLETAIESLNTAGTDSLNVNTVSTLVLVANRVGLGGAVPTTSSTAAAIKGFFRTAASINSLIRNLVRIDSRRGFDAGAEVEAAQDAHNVALDQARRENVAAMADKLHYGLAHSHLPGVDISRPRQLVRR